MAGKINREPWKAWKNMEFWYGKELRKYESAYWFCLKKNIFKDSCLTLDKMLLLCFQVGGNNDLFLNLRTWNWNRILDFSLLRWSKQDLIMMSIEIYSKLLSSEMNSDRWPIDGSICKAMGWRPEVQFFIASAESEKGNKKFKKPRLSTSVQDVWPSEMINKLWAVWGSDVMM